MPILYIEKKMLDKLVRVGYNYDENSKILPIVTLDDILEQLCRRITALEAKNES